MKELQIMARITEAFREFQKSPNEVEVGQRLQKQWSNGSLSFRDLQKEIDSLATELNLDRDTIWIQLSRAQNPNEPI